jgi:DUF4097 and DUF4098 domain-containing protein YvlB
LTWRTVEVKTTKAQRKEGIVKSVVLMLALVALAAPVASGADMERRFDVKSGQKLWVDLEPGGAISISGWDRDEVLVRVDYNDYRPGDIEIDFDQSGSGIEVTSELIDHWGRDGGRAPDFEIMVPRKFSMELQTLGGSIDIEGVEGEFEGLTMGGSLNLSNLKGDIALRTMGGNITCRDSELDGSVSTMGGQVLMENLVGNVKGSSMGGHVIYKNVASRDGVSTEGTVDISTMGGNISVNEAPDGAKVSTMGGDIHIKKAAKFVRAKTMGGDVRIDDVDGWVKATTMGGDIDVVMTGDPDKGDREVSLTSLSGDIELTVPSGLSMDVDIELAYTKGHEGDYDIHSDFEIEKERTEHWEDENGSPRKYIYGKGKIKGGKNRILIKTINGDVYLKED